MSAILPGSCLQSPPVGRNYGDSTLIAKLKGPKRPGRLALSTRQHE